MFLFMHMNNIFHNISGHMYFKKALSLNMDILHSQAYGGQKI